MNESNTENHEVLHKETVMSTSECHQQNGGRTHLTRKLSNALYEILVGLPVTSNDLTHHWYHME